MATTTKTKKKKVTPLDDRILIKPTKAEDKTSSGIILPEAAKEKPMTATVVAVGPGKMTDNGKRAKISVKKGDVVVYGKYSGSEIEIDGESLVIVRENELLGVIEK